MIPLTDILFPRHDFVSTPLREPDPARFETEALIGHILRRYHEVHRRDFPEAIRLARRVDAAHADHPDRPRGLTDHLALMAADLEDHQQKEEQILFPMMLAGGAPMIRFPIGRMLAEHEDVEDQLRRLKQLTGAFRAPQGACGSWRELYRLCAKIDEDLREHMRLENDVLFARFLDEATGRDVF